MSALRAELLGESTPDFTLALPTGWIRRDVGDETREELLRQARTRLMGVHRPDLYGQLTAMTEQAFREMERTETIAFFAPGPDAPDEAYLPVSVTASIRRGPDGATLDDTIAHIIRSSGATPLGEDKRFVRWETSGRQVIEGTGVDTTTVAYLTPIPGSGRRRALQFTVVITHDTGAPGDEDWLAQVTAIFDIYMSTFGWVST